ncbi:MAG: peroxiredoxin family protein, partial [Planctomycetota bacterium]
MSTADLSVYNHDSFHREVMRDLRFRGGPGPGERAPDFDLPTTEIAGRFRLSSRREVRPVLLTFGSLTCPYTLGALDALRALYPVFEGRLDFVTVYVREMHPGELHPQPRTLHEKLRHAREWKRLDEIPWTVAVDRLDGEVHRAFGLLPTPAFLIDSKGRVAFRTVWSG